ncbi:MAG TPA: hypothetical protein GX708_19535 [Gallicola sp.]|jgi:hypothetical protein|nr:hypothetical protein [Gallicola sp.]
MPKPFPPNIELDFENSDKNPAIQLFGKRFFIDQTPLELLIELILVMTSPKKINEIPFDSFLPPISLLKNKWITPLKYAPRSRLNLKLFAFFGASKLDTRHETHREHLMSLYRKLMEKISVSGDTQENVVHTLENLFLGFHGVGAQRTWCAQHFLPICRELIAGESIWKASKALDINDWHDALKYFSHNQYIFLARGGEVLYLQICNALRRDKKEIESWVRNNNLLEYFTSKEMDPEWLCNQLNKVFSNVYKQTPSTISRIAEFIDQEIDVETSLKTDGSEDKRRWTNCSWCPEETWPESYLFAVELLRICRANLDLMDRIELLEIACVMQVMRTLITQAQRYCQKESDTFQPYYFVISDPEGKNKALKQISRATIQKTSKTIYDGLRHPEIINNIPQDERNKLYNEADRRYGHKLFINLGKKIGLIIPRRGPGMRFVLTGTLIRFLIVALCPEPRLTYDSFKKGAEVHFGMVFDEDSLNRANCWAIQSTNETYFNGTDEWLIKMIEEAGALRRLSDSCAMVENLVINKR